MRDRRVIPLTAPAALLTFFFIWREGGDKFSEASLKNIIAKLVELNTKIILQLSA
jgi:hypothetical protein